MSEPANNLVFLLWHVHEMEDGGEDDVKLLGVYSTREKAEQAITRVAKKPGFADLPNGFEISDYKLDKDCWVDGFVTVEWGD